MSFWDLFKTIDEAESKYTCALHEKVATLVPNTSEDEQILITCVAGLMARVAYVDFKIHEGEEEEIEKSLKKWTKLSSEDVIAVRKLALTEIKALAGIDNHKYCHPLNDLLEHNQRFELVEALFALAAGDGEVELKESEEIRLISIGLKLENKYFISARATVVDYLKSLKK